MCVIRKYLLIFNNEITWMRPFTTISMNLLKAQICMYIQQYTRLRWPSSFLCRVDHKYYYFQDIIGNSIYFCISIDSMILYTKWMPTTTNEIQTNTSKGRSFGSTVGWSSNCEAHTHVVTLPRSYLALFILFTFN